MAISSETRLDEKGIADAVVKFLNMPDAEVEFIAQHKDEEIVKLVAVVTNVGPASNSSTAETRVSRMVVKPS